MICGYTHISYFIFTLAVCKLVSGTLLEQLNIYASQNQYTAQMFQTPFPTESIMIASLELAVQSCQASSQWQQWNCPSMDFLRRYNSKPTRFDREDAYVNAIATAGMLYTITKRCASGLVSDCMCDTTDCYDNVDQAERLYERHMGQKFGKTAFGQARQHNQLAVLNLMRKTELRRQCGCRVPTASGECAEEVCRDVLPPFAEIAADVWRMYDESLQLDINVGGKNTRVVWSNVPLDVLVYMKDSPNYCEPDAVPLWNGIQGRECTLTDEATGDDRCAALCEPCGLRVRTRDVVLEQACNCHFIPWTFQMQCDRCVSIEQQHFCY